ncbi:MAG: hypothetical protein IT371_13880 [Deltaproteobacteria bacterium]|nr:hypothetical protein [Deltaproteobacteria bacterium]
MIQRWVSGLLVLLSLAGPVPAHGRADPSGAPRELLRQAIDLYVAGQYRAAADRLRPLVEARALQDPADQREALRTYGITLYLAGAPAGAERAFRELLRIAPFAELDPSFARPEVVQFFHQVRRLYRHEQDELLRRRGPRGPAIVNLLPPWGQFQNGHRRKAYLLLAGELVFAAGSVTTAALLYGMRDETGQFGRYEGAYRPLQALNVATFASLAVLLVYGIVDGLYHYYRGPRDPAASPLEARLPGHPSAALLRF